MSHVHLLKPYYARSSGAKEWESAKDGQPVLLASTLTSLGSSFCHARSVHGEEDVPGPDDCVLQGRLKKSDTGCFGQPICSSTC